MASTQPSSSLQFLELFDTAAAAVAYVLKHNDLVAESKEGIAAQEALKEWTRTARVTPESASLLLRAMQAVPDHPPPRLE